MLLNKYIKLTTIIHVHMVPFFLSAWPMTISHNVSERPQHNPDIVKYNTQLYISTIY